MNEADVILHHFYKHAAARPDAIYLTQPVGGDRVDDYSYARALDEAKRVAAYLKSLDLPAESQIAIVSKNCAEFILADLAIWMAGHVSVALYPTLAAGTVQYILEHSEAKLLFVGKLDDWDEIQRGVPDGLACVAFTLAPEGTGFKSWKEILAEFDPIDGEPRRQPDDKALIVYTSGSTGQPKGVLHSFQTISLPTHSLVKTLGITPDDRMLSYLPLAHTMDRWLSECVSMASGHRLYFAESLTSFVQDLQRCRPTLFISVPRLWLKFQLGVARKMPQEKLNWLLKIPILSGIVKSKILTQLGLDSVRFAGSGSAPIPAELLTWYRRLGLELLEGYGMSENFNFSHLTMPGKAKAGYIGHPHPGVEHRLSDAGEILVKSPGTMVGYFKQEELTREAFTDDGFLKTGDRGEIDDQGRLKITGRVKELFKTSKGKYVAPAPIENIINNDPNIELSVIAGSGYPATHAVLQLAEDLVPKLSDPAVKARITKDLEALLVKVNANIEEFERVQFLAVPLDRWSIEGGQLTPTMKIRRSSIEEAYAPHLDAWYATGDKVIWQE